MRQVDWVVVPSVWWENSPLVIQEAFAAGRPVVCSGIGGMAEKVPAGTAGLHFRAGDPGDLADVMRRAATEPGLWDRLRAGLPTPHPMPAHVARLAGLYESLLTAAGG
jgi:glycosyltransferase involved in cell wall biosynthesis